MYNIVAPQEKIEVDVVHISIKIDILCYFS